jgi:hypothetical protein
MYVGEENRTHLIGWDNFSVREREEHSLRRERKESVLNFDEDFKTRAKDGRFVAAGSQLLHG